MACFIARHLAAIQPQMNACKYMDLRSFTYHICAYLQVCSRSSIFCRFGGGAFLFPGIFFTSPVINHESSSGKRRKHSPWPQHVSSVTTPLHKGRFSGAANLRAALNHSFVKMFPLKTKVFPPLFFSVLSVCDLFFPHSFTERGPYPKAECRNEREAEQRSGRNHFVPPSLLC